MANKKSPKVSGRPKSQIPEINIKGKGITQLCGSISSYPPSKGALRVCGNFIPLGGVQEVIITIKNQTGRQARQEGPYIIVTVK